MKIPIHIFWNIDYDYHSSCSQSARSNMESYVFLSYYEHIGYGNEMSLSPGMASKYKEYDDMAHFSRYASYSLGSYYTSGN